MIHYNVWFGVRENVEEVDALHAIRMFLAELHSSGSIESFQLLRNHASGAKTKLSRFQALIEFRDDAQFAAAFRDQAAKGIHTGMHGRIVSLVSGFHVEVFSRIVDSSSINSPFECACEV